MARMNKDCCYKFTSNNEFSRDRIDNNISFMFNASNISWHIIMKARITIGAFDQDKNEAKGKRKQRGTWLVTRN